MKLSNVDLFLVPSLLDKYFINLYEGAYKFYTDKVSYLDDERKKNYIYKNNTTEIYNEDYKRDIEKIENYGNK